jgi:hypothetical protein
MLKLKKVDPLKIDQSIGVKEVKPEQKKEEIVKEKGKSNQH